MWGLDSALLWWALLSILSLLGSSDDPQGCPSAPRQAPGLTMLWGWVFLVSNWDMPRCNLRLCPAPRDMENRQCPSPAQPPLACLKTLPAASLWLATLHRDSPAPPAGPHGAVQLHALPTPASWRLPGAVPSHRVTSRVLQKGPACSKACCWAFLACAGPSRFTWALQ